MDCSGTWAPYALSVFTCVASALISVIAGVSNALIIVAVVWDPLKKLHTPFNYFLVNIAVSDLIMGFVVMPISVVNHYKESVQQVTESSRIVIRLAYLMAATSTLLGIIALSIDRFIAIKWAILYRAYVNYWRCCVVSVFIWAASIGLPFLYFVMGYRNYLLLQANSSFLLALIFSLGIYVQVYLFLRAHTQDLRQRMRVSSTAGQEFELKRMLMEKKVTRTFLVILIVFVFTYLPAVVMIYLIFFCSVCSCTTLHVLRDLQFILVALNSCLNPFICTIRLKPFSDSIKTIFQIIRRKFT